MKKGLLVSLTLNVLSIMPTSTSWALGFQQTPLPDKVFSAMEAANTFNEHSPVARDRLRLLTIQHVDFDGNTHTGHLVVLDACADAALAIFQSLYEMKFPIQKARLMHHYQGNDELATADNNTSCYNCRVIGGSTSISLHAYGTAIDINPLLNPFVRINEAQGTATYEPVEGVQYANRQGGKRTRGMAETVVALFAQHGFNVWGGNWYNGVDDWYNRGGYSPQKHNDRSYKRIDFQHFQLSRALTELLVVMDNKTASSCFQIATQYFNTHHVHLEKVLEERLQAELGNGLSLAECYQQHSAVFDQAFRQLTQASL